MAQVAVLTLSGWHYCGSESRQTYGECTATRGPDRVAACTRGHLDADSCLGIWPAGHAVVKAPADCALA